MCKFLVFVGASERRAQLEANFADWHVYEAPADPVMGALAQVIALLPDAVILEDSAAARMVYMHLESIQFAPLIVLTDTDDAFAAFPEAYTLPLDATTAELHMLLEAMDETLLPSL